MDEIKNIAVEVDGNVRTFPELFAFVRWLAEGYNLEITVKIR